MPVNPISDRIYALAAIVKADPRIARLDRWLEQHPMPPITRNGWGGFAQMMDNLSSPAHGKRLQAVYLRRARVAQLHGHRDSAMLHLAGAAAIRPIGRDQP